MVADSLYKIRYRVEKELRVPLMALVKYKGFKVLVRAATAVDELN